MKKQISVALLGLALLFAAAASASAQATAHMRIHVPFDFVAGKKLLHAGDYSVRRVSDAAASGLIIQREDGGDAAVLLTNSNGGVPSRAALTFRQYGEHYFLAEVSIPGTSSVRRLPKDGAEKKAERETIEEAAAGGEAKTVTVTGSLR
ncbi:MAG TPA: hypothetical protein VJ866_12435 [Pyrinomonadaceae bacterium]|nr:hypothetical protein [Pyrinomonadaceae bacterium]